MELFIPIIIESISSSVRLPFTIFKNDEFQIVVNEFSFSDKEWFFNINNLKKLPDNSYSYQPNDDYSTFYKEPSSDFFDSNMLLLIKHASDFPRELQNIELKMDFILKLVIGKGVKINRIRCSDKKSIYHNSGMNYGRHCVSRRAVKTLKNNHLRRFTNLFNKLENKENFKKIETLKFLLDTAMNQTGDMKTPGGFYVTILESIFCPDGKSGEITYKTSMRLAKYKKKNLTFQKKIKDLYGKRSNIFHAGKGSFTLDEIKFLEEEACNAIENYILYPQDFTEEKLDRLLLK